MKKHLCLFVCLAISLAILAGCGNPDKGKSTAGTEKNVTETASNQPAETTDWEPTKFATINNFEGVAMTVKKETVSSTGLTMVYKNNSSSQCTFGEDFSLEKKINGQWYQVPVVEGNYGFNDVGYELGSGDEREWLVDWDWLYGSLDKGEYRIVKSILDFRGTGDYDKYYLAAEFVIK